MYPLIIEFAVFISLFLFGMTLLRTGLLFAGENRTANWLESVTNNPINSVFVGTIASALLQSSSALLVMTVALVAAKQLRFSNAVGIVLGANIGTTVTLEILAFRADAMTVPLLVAGAFFLMTGKKRWMLPGSIAFGLGCMLVSMNGFGQMANDLLGFIDQVMSIEEATYGQSFLAGNIATIIIQSSSAALAIVMTMLETDGLSLDLALSFMLGTNIGTCATAFLASIGAGRAAFYVALSHLAINVLGAIIFYPILGAFTDISMALATAPSAQLAHASVIYNIVTSVVALPLLWPLAKMIEKQFNLK
ncbi:Na/Pi cotransporter family protein [Bacillaceae bacterium SIJ1]|uniref:Na/Pi symporter n=1 Tax=Litoribacterium kuwaitense TaxID=1398745 RepID=UPI0013EA5812|nr:Na/Pi symporter [Litoribacterium kuwaitense]NGP43514.1 Na/Pi cotransporter family protein [Litoribacterium kuwaitense]